MPRVYTVAFENQSITNANGDYDLMEILAADDKPTELVWFRIGQSTELAEAQEEQLRIGIVRGNTTSGNGSATTPRPKSSADAAYGGTVETVASTPASAGTALQMLADDMNVRGGYEWGPKPQGQGEWVNGTDLLCVRLHAAVADDLSMSFTAEIIEYP